VGAEVCAQMVDILRGGNAVCGATWPITYTWAARAELEEEEGLFFFFTATSHQWLAYVGALQARLDSERCRLSKKVHLLVVCG
jgi:hypothetical protein